MPGICSESLQIYSELYTKVHYTHHYYVDWKESVDTMSGILEHILW